MLCRGNALAFPRRNSQLITSGGHMGECSSSYEDENARENGEGGADLDQEGEIDEEEPDEEVFPSSVNQGMHLFGRQIRRMAELTLSRLHRTLTFLRIHSISLRTKRVIPSVYSFLSCRWNTLQATLPQYDNKGGPGNSPSSPARSFNGYDPCLSSEATRI